MSHRLVYKVFVVEFTSPYQVKYHGIPSLPEEVIDASIVLRSIVYASSLIGGDVEGLVDAITAGEVRATSILPTIECANAGIVPLVPFPSLLKVLLVEKTVKGDPKVVRGISYTIPDVVGELSKSVVEGEVVIEEEPTVIRVSGREYRVKATVLLPSTSKLVDCIGNSLFYYVDFIRNRIDRITGAADPYHSSYVMPAQRMYFIVQLPSDLVNTVVSAVRLLEDMGIGSKKSIGLGRFRIEKILDLEDYSRELYGMVKDNGDKMCYWVSMGKYFPEEAYDSVFYESDIVAGISGHVIPYTIPALKVMLPGATIGCSEEAPIGLKELVNHPSKSIVVFNPLFYALKDLRCPCIECC